MWEEILKAFTLVFLPSVLKFIFGPIGGKAAGLNIITTMIATTLGMMTSVVVFTFFGEYIRKWAARFFKRKEKKPTNKKYILLFRKYGLSGIAFFTPILLTPIGGTLLAVSFTSDRRKIIVFMLISACAWSVILTMAVYFGYDAVMKFINRIQPV
ncbi:MAG: small multi-drug export protein [Bacteroidota bacterium]